MKNLAVIALATLLSASAFAQRTVERVEVRPEVRARQTAEIARARATLKTDADRTLFDEAKNALGEASMARIGTEFARNLNGPRTEATDAQAMSAALAGLKTAAADVATIKNEGHKGRVQTAIEGALISEMKALQDTTGAVSNPQQFGEVMIEIGQMAKAGNIDNAVRMAEQVSKLNRTVSARAGRYGENRNTSVINTSYTKAVNSLAGELHPQALGKDGNLIPGSMLLLLNPNAVVNRDGNVVIKEGTNERAFDAERDITVGTAQTRESYLTRFRDAWREVIRCMGGKV